MRLLTAFLRFWYDFVVGDAWDIAAGIVVVLGLGALLASRQALPSEGLALAVGAGIVLVVGASLLLEARATGVRRRWTSTPRAGQPAWPVDQLTGPGCT